MKAVDYEKLETAVHADCLAALNAFCASPDNVAVYAVALQVDKDHGDWALGVNTEQAFYERIVARYPDVKDLHCIGGSRWNPAEFKHFDIAASAESKRLMFRFGDVCRDCFGCHC